MRLWSDSFTEGGQIPPACAFAQIDPQRHVRYARNRNPHLAWDDVPPGSESLALFCCDLDAPAVGG
ncbi:MAG: phospholipid-binding protein, partial [Pseudomonadota bacterium]|nr:phospholipid-binding protein [Pseudomonadota bacterium]